MAVSETTRKMRERTREKIFAVCERPPDVRKVMRDVLGWIPKDDPITVFMSGGIDSHVCLFGCLDLGLNVSCTSFTLDTHESSDFKAAKHAAGIFGLDFHPVILDSSEEHLKKWVRFAVHKLGIKNKSALECSWPLYMAIRQTEAKHIVLGLGGDSHFLLAKSRAMHCRDIVAETRQHAFRRALQQNDLVKSEACKRGKYAHLPFFDMGRMYAELQNETDYEKINSPQKSFYHQAYPEYRKLCKVKQHQNFQLGDTNIAKNFSDKLLASDWNVRNSKSVVGIYNDVIAGRI